jgi:hypothetical protein
MKTSHRQKVPIHHRPMESLSFFLLF